MEREKAVLNLTLKKQWYNMVSDINPATRKDDEYRALKPYWVHRLTKQYLLPENIMDTIFKHFDTVKFTNGYGAKRPSVTRQCLGISIGIGKKEWGAPTEPVFIIHLEEILN